MNGGIQQFARVLDHVSKSAKTHAERRLADMSPERRAQLEREWNDTSFDAAYDFGQRWNNKEK